MSSLGRLLQPFVEVTWGDLNLSDWDYGDKMKRPVVYGVSVDLDTGDEVVNKASMEFDPSPVGFKAYVKCVSEEYAKKPIKIKFGYEKGSTMETVYFFQNVDFSTGKDQSITVHLSGLHKNRLTSHWWNEYVGNGKSEFTIKELFDGLTKKIGMKVEYAQGAEEVIKNLPKMTSAQVVNTTLGGFMLKVAKDHGLSLEYPTGAKEDHDKIIVRTKAKLDPKLSVSVEKNVNEKVEVGAKRKDKRLGFIIGPTLATTITRKTNPFAATENDSDASHNIRLTGTKGDAEKENDPTKLGQAKSNPTETAAPTQAEKPPSGSTSTNDKSVTKECVDKNGKALTGDKLTKCRAKIAEKKEKKAEGELSEMDTSVFMVPYMVGIKPYDFVVFPSLKGDYIEDWEIGSVSYKQEGGAIVISLNGKRPQVGAGNLLDESTLKKFKDKVKELDTLRKWENYYWNVK